MYGLCPMCVFLPTAVALTECFWSPAPKHNMQLITSTQVPCTPCKLQNSHVSIQEMSVTECQGVSVGSLQLQGSSHNYQGFRNTERVPL